MKKIHKLKMIWRILRDRQVVVITESYGRLYRNWDARSLEDVCQMCCKAFDKAKEMLDKSKHLGNKTICDKQNRKVAKPIPLTPEILEKNGWREEKGDYINGNYHIILCEKNDGYSAYKVVNDAIVWLRDVESVSDLQHLFFGLNINSEMEV